MARAHDGKYRFQWREGNRVTLLRGGAQFYPAMLEAISAARSHVLLEMYLVTSGAVSARFVAALAEAAARGVECCVLLDDFGARGLRMAERERLREQGVHLAFYNPLRLRHPRRGLFRDHRKILVVDGAVAFTGGAGITDDFDPEVAALAWHETMVRVEGPVVADWQSLFLTVWGHRNAQPALPGLRLSAPLAGGVRARVVLSQGGRRRQEIKRSLINRLRMSRERAWISVAYFVPSRKLLRLLCRCARRGVDVRLLLPGERTDHPAVRHAGRRYYQRLLRAGVRIFEYQPRVLHSKVMVCDQWASVGSCNIDRWNLRWNLEANQEVEDAGVSERVAAGLEEDFAQSTEITPHNWHRRPLGERLRERFWGWVDRWLERLRVPPGPPP